MTQDDANKLHIDSDWKAEAQAEKERLAQKEQQRDASTQGGQAGGGQGQLPAADFRGLIGLLATQAISGLGAFGDQKEGRVMVDLEGSRFYIDLLSVIEEKTQGNLSDDEAKELSGVIAELRSRYVEISKLAAAQQAAGAQTGQEQPGGQPGSGDQSQSGGGGSVITDV